MKARNASMIEDVKILNTVPTTPKPNPFKINIVGT